MRCEQILTGEGPLGQLQLELGLPEWGVDLLVLGIVGYAHCNWQCWLYAWPLYLQDLAACMPWLFIWSYDLGVMSGR